MIDKLLINSPVKADRLSVYRVFEVSIPDTLEREGLALPSEDIEDELTLKKRMLDAFLDMKDPQRCFLVARLGGAVSGPVNGPVSGAVSGPVNGAVSGPVIGTVSFGPCGQDIRRCTEDQLRDVGELGNLYVLPEYQGQGVGSALIAAMIGRLHERGVDWFCLDSGYRRAQKRWLRKFGAPYNVVKDYWGPGFDHMVWLCRVSDFAGER